MHLVNMLKVVESYKARSLWCSGQPPESKSVVAAEEAKEQQYQNWVASNVGRIVIASISRTYPSDPKYTAAVSRLVQRTLDALIPLLGQDATAQVSGPACCVLLRPRSTACRSFARVCRLPLSSWTPCWTKRNRFTCITDRRRSASLFVC